MKSKPTIINLQKDYRLRQITISTPKAILLMLISLLILSVAQSPFNVSWLVWLGLVGWVLANIGLPSTKKAMTINFLTAIAYFIVNLYWLNNVTLPGWIALSIYLAGYFVLTGWLIRKIYEKKRWPMALVLPVLWVAQEYLRATIVTGFPWLFLSHTQHHNLRLIQCSDILGAYGVTFIIAMVNGLLCDLLLRPLIAKPKSGQRPLFWTAQKSIISVLIILLANLYYGSYRIKQTSQTISKGPLITVIQEAIPQSVKEAGQSSRDIFAKHMELSQQALMYEPRPAMIVWPETVISYDLNFLPGLSDILIEKYIEQSIEALEEAIKDKNLSEDQIQQRRKGIEDYYRCPKDFDRQLKALAKANNIYMIIGALTEDYHQEQSYSYNSAYLYQPDGTQSQRRYDKMHLVPFGEVVPFKESWPWLNRVLNSFTPYDYDYSLDYGKNATIFKMETDEKTYDFGVMICYEDVVPRIARKLSFANKTKTDFLLNISNDGWFVRAENNEKKWDSGDYGKIIPSTELSQHLAISRFRAIENRIGIARSVNTGISAFIRPDGYIQKDGIVNTLAADAFDRGGQVGFVTDYVYCDSRVTIYNYIGDSFAIVSLIVSAIMLFYVFIGKDKRNEKN